MQEDPSTRRGRKPSTESEHPLGRLVRERRLARNWSIKQLAEMVGIGDNSWSLISEIERGRRAPSLQVAEQLARVLDLQRNPLLEWATGERGVIRRYGEAVGSAGELIEWAPGPLGSVTTSERQSDDDVALLPAGMDPDGRKARPVAWIPRRHFPTSLAGSLVRPVAFVVADEDFDRLERPIYGGRRPRFAVVSRPAIQTIDPREPYAVRRRGMVKLAYIAWDGREVFILPPPGRPGFDRAVADGVRGLEKRLVGQVVAMLGWTDREGLPQAPPVTRRG